MSWYWSREDLFVLCGELHWKSLYCQLHKEKKKIEDEENTNEREETSQYPPIISYDESGNEEELSIQPISLIRS